MPTRARSIQASRRPRRPALTPNFLNAQESSFKAQLCALSRRGGAAPREQAFAPRAGRVRRAMWLRAQVGNLGQVAVNPRRRDGERGNRGVDTALILSLFNNARYVFARGVSRLQDAGKARTGCAGVSGASGASGCQRPLSGCSGCRLPGPAPAVQQLPPRDTEQTISYTRRYITSVRTTYFAPTSRAGDS